MFADAPFGELLRDWHALITVLLNDVEPIEYDGDYIRILKAPGQEPTAHLLPRYRKKPIRIQKPVSIPVIEFDEPIGRFKKHLAALSPRNHELEELVNKLQVALDRSRQYSDTDAPRYVMPRIEGPLLDEIQRQIRRYDTSHIIDKGPLNPADEAITPIANDPVNTNRHRRGEIQVEVSRQTGANALKRDVNDCRWLNDELTKKRMAHSAALVNYMTKPESADFDEIKHQVHGDKDVSDGAVRKNVSKTNKQLVMLGSQLTFYTRGGRVFKNER
jgi:hypothetical protein